MRIIKTERFNVTDSAEKEYQFNNNLVGDTVASEMYVYTDADIAVTATGYVDAADTGSTLTAINMNSFATGDITKAGTYLIMTGSLEKVKMTFTGAGNITVKILY